MKYRHFYALRLTIWYDTNVQSERKSGSFYRREVRIKLIIVSHPIQLIKITLSLRVRHLSFFLAKKELKSIRLRQRSGNVSARNTLYKYARERFGDLARLANLFNFMKVNIHDVGMTLYGPSNMCIFSSSVVLSSASITSSEK